MPLNRHMTLRLLEKSGKKSGDQAANQNNNGD